MRDLIDRQMTIDALIFEGRTVEGHYTEYERIIYESDAIEAISLLPSAEPKWIPVEERLPEDRGRYICYISNEYIITCKWYPDIKAWFPDYEYAGDDVKAWMPLPEPYEEMREGMDLIDRKQVLKEISERHKEAIEYVLKTIDNDETKAKAESALASSIEWLLNKIQRLPSAEPGIIQCKDCK